MAFTMAYFLEFAGVFGWVTALLTFAANTKLIRLCQKNINPNFQQYPKLMIGNSLNLMMFSAIHAIGQPIISVEKSVVYVFTATNLVKLPKIGMRVILSAYGATYCSSLVMCAVMFIYRYKTICHKTSSNSNSQYFDSNTKMFFWFVFISTIGLYWGLSIFLLAHDTPYVDSIIASSLVNYYGKNLSEVTYVAAVYQINDNGTMINNYSSIYMGLSFVTIIAASMFTTILCVWKIARRSRNSVEPLRVIEALQKQLWKAQMAQASIPFMLVFLPIAGVLILPLLELNGNVAFSAVSILVACYPVLDPLVLMMFITEFRKELCGKGDK